MPKADPNTVAASPLSIPDHTLIRCIGSGAYGEVWLARNSLGTRRAVKIVRRAAFDDDRPYEREFAGIQKFEPISRSHEGFVDLLQVGRNDAEGWFYYLMELADDSNAERGTRNAELNPAQLFASSIQHSELRIPHSYLPRTLAADVRLIGALPLDECLNVARTLASALVELHRHGLVHRDIKPSNIIFVGGVPKLADIGLVAVANEARSFVGTEGFIPPEGPGAQQADLYSLGIVLYVISTGKSHRDFPEPPADLALRPDRERWLELQAIIHRACQADPRQRYANAKAMLADVELLDSGKSVKQRHEVESRWRWVRRGAVWVAAAALVVTLMGFINYSWPRVSPEATRRSTNDFAQRQYDLGRNHDRSNDADLNKITQYYRDAVNADPNFVLAPAVLAAALCWGHQYPLGYNQFPNLSEALVIAEKALERDDNLSEAHLAVAWHAFIRERNWSKATRHFKKAIRCNPRNSQPYEWYGMFLFGIGRTNDAIQNLTTATHLSSGLAANDFLGQALVAARDYTNAARAFEKTLEMPGLDKRFSHRELARAVWWRDRTNEAIERWMDALYGANEPWVSDLKRILRQQGQPAFWNARAKALRELTKDPLILAEACAMAGLTEEALDLLEQAHRERHDFLVLKLKTDPEWDGLRHQPRFKVLLRSLNLTE